MNRLHVPLFVSKVKSARFDVVGVGENSLDKLLRLDEWPQPGDKLTALPGKTRPGGQVASALLGCARLGLTTAYLGAVGEDEEAQAVLEPLAEAGVDLSGVQRIPGARTRTALILIRERDGERSVIAQHDPRLGIASSALDRGRIRGARALLVDVSDPEASLWAARVARDEGIPVVLDADHVLEGIEALLKFVDFPVVSERFAMEWGNSDSVRPGVERLSRGGARLAIATCGGRGAWVASASRTWQSSALEVEVCDTTGAGDAFHAGMIWALLRGSSVDQVLRSAHAAAGLACCQLGAQAGLPSLGELTSFLGTNPVAKTSPQPGTDRA